MLLTFPVSCRGQIRVERKLTSVRDFTVKGKGGSRSLRGFNEDVVGMSKINGWQIRERERDEVDATLSVKREAE